LLKRRRGDGMGNAIFFSGVIQILVGKTTMRLEVCKQNPSILYGSEIMGALEEEEGHDVRKDGSTADCYGCSTIDM
jgi:hypothetical protein